MSVSHTGPCAIPFPREKVPKPRENKPSQDRNKKRYTNEPIIIHHDMIYNIRISGYILHVHTCAACGFQVPVFFLLADPISTRRSVIFKKNCIRISGTVTYLIIRSYLVRRTYECHTLELQSSRVQSCICRDGGFSAKRSCCGA